MNEYDSYVRIKYRSSLHAAVYWIRNNGLHCNPKVGTNKFYEMEAINRWYAQDHPDDIKPSLNSESTKNIQEVRDENCCSYG